MVQEHHPVGERPMEVIPFAVMGLALLGLPIWLVRTGYQYVDRWAQDGGLELVGRRYERLDSNFRSGQVGYRVTWIDGTHRREGIVVVRGFLFRKAGLESIGRGLR
jgi:hypothetical protein